MKTHSELPAKSPAITRLALSLALASLASVLMAAIASGTLSRLAAEAEERGSIVVWYVQGGHWREDVEMYLMHPEQVLFPSNLAATRINPAKGNE